jgi:thiosulfate/3-mercaptopyruvate sulfurtransferase
MSSSYTLTNYLVTPHELDLALQKNVYSKLSTAPRIIPLCATWFLPNDPKKRTGKQSFLESRIPKARFFDLDAVKDKDSPYPHMLPSAEAFAKAMGELGIRRDDSVVVYDSSDLGIFSAPRVAWTLKAFGHDTVHILNNYKLWVDQGYPVETGDQVASFHTVDYPVSQLDSNKVVSFEELKEKVSEQGKEGAEDFQILDARPVGRFEGKDPEPREGRTAGSESPPPHRHPQLTYPRRSLIWSHPTQHLHPLLGRSFRPHEGPPPRPRTKTLL